jgi:hypothetical protein
MRTHMYLLRHKLLSFYNDCLCVLLHMWFFHSAKEQLEDLECI